MHIPAICSAVLVSVPSASGGVAASGVQTEGRVLILFTALSDMFANFGYYMRSF